MAGDWMMIDLELADKPEVDQIATTLKIDHDAVVGKLVRVWSWFDKQTVDGHAPGVTDALLDRITVCDGFAAAMTKARWLERSADGLKMPKFDTWNGQSAKKRALAYRRQAKKRNANVTQVSRADRDKNVTRDRDREELKLTPIAPPVGKKLNGNGEHSARKKPATRAPDSFEITEPMWAWATGEGVPHERVETETAKFLDHHKAKDSAFSDWPAAWRKWMRNVVDFAQQRAH